MSIVTLQIGQCGNQIGGQLFSTLVDDCLQPTPRSGSAAATNALYTEACVERFFSVKEDRGGKETWTARAVMVDMEQKAITQTRLDAERSGKWRYPAEKLLCQKRGSGNNWARGYCGHGPEVEELIMASIQRQAECCDRVGGFLTLMSLAGGTGSGVGSYLTQSVRDEFPHSFIVNQVVWPYASGEVAVQSYNAVLSLAHIYQSADAIVALENDVLQRICSQLLAITQVSFSDVNRVIAHKLASILAPVHTSFSHDAPILRNHLGDILEMLVPHPEYKMLSLRSIPLTSERSSRYTTYQWPGLLKHLRQMLIANCSMEEGIDWQVKPWSADVNRSLANLLLLRGRDCHTVDVSPFNDPALYGSWHPSEDFFATWSHPRSFLGYEKSATLLSKDSGAVQCLDATVERAWQMFAARAYVHQYAKHGLEEDTFVDCFATLEQVLSSYRNL